MGHSLRFLGTFVKCPKTVGAIAPSSRFLADCMVNWIDWDQVDTVVEFGPGTGIFTELILKAKARKTKYIGVEKEEFFCGLLRDRYQGESFHQNSAANVKQICEKENVSKVDVVISGLPWAAFDRDLQSRILTATQSVLSEKGRFATFAYIHGLMLPAAHRFKKELDKNFTDIQKSCIVWKNLPPAFVYYCTK